MRIITKISLISAIILILLITVLTYNASQNISDLLEANKEQQVTTVTTGLENILDSQFNLLTIGLEPVIQNPQIIEAFANRDRERLAQLTLPLMDKLNEQGVRQFQFHLPNMTSFYRVHEPEKFGDDLSAFRQTVVEANKTNKIVQGLEGGVAGVGFRYVVPVEYNGQHIGSVELGMGITDQLLNNFKEDYGGEWTLYGIDNTKSNLDDWYSR